MSKLPLLSSEEIIKALKRAGFRPARHSKGSHLAMVEEREGRKITTIVVLGKKEVPRGTLRDIIKLAELSREEFLSLLGHSKRQKIAGYIRMSRDRSDMLSPTFKVVSFIFKCYPYTLPPKSFVEEYK